MKKIIVIGIIALFFGLAFIPSFNAVSISNSDDTTPPSIELCYEILSYYIYDWEYLFTAICNDTESGMDRVEFCIDDVIMETDYSEPYEYICWWSQLKGHKFFTATAYDKAGNSEVAGGIIRPRSVDIKSTEEDCIECQSNGKTYLAEKILNRLEKDEVLSNVIKSNNPDYRPICIILGKLLQHYCDLMIFYGNLSDSYPKDSFLHNFYYLIAASCGKIIEMYMVILLLAGCKY